MVLDVSVFYTTRTPGTYHEHDADVSCCNIRRCGRDDEGGHGKAEWDGNMEESFPCLVCMPSICERGDDT